MKSFIRFFVEKVQFTYIVILGLIILGVNSLIIMPRSEDPDMDFPYYTIVVILPGASPTEIKDQIITPIEDCFNDLEDVREIKSKAWSNLAFISIEYEHKVDRATKYQEVIREIEKLRSEKLSKDIVEIKVHQVKSNDISIAQIALFSEKVNYSDLEKYATELKNEFKKIKGLQEIKVWGYPEQEVRIELDLQKIAQYKIPINNIINTLRRNSYTFPAGDVVSGNTTFSIKTGEEENSIQKIENTIIYTIGKQNLHLKDFAKIKKSYKDEKHLIRLNGVKSVLVTVNLKKDFNIIAVSKEIQNKVDELQSKLPLEIKLEKNFDQSKSVNKRLNKLGKDLVLALLLVMITLLPLGWRSTLVVMISIPLSLAIGIIGLDFFGYGLNQLSIVGLIIALGIIVDDSIVVNENIERSLRNGISLNKAVVESTNKIAIPVIGVTITLIIAFIPIVCMPGDSGDFIRSLPLAIILSVLGSLFVSLALVPFLSTRILKEKTDTEGNIFLRILKKGTQVTYGKIMHYSLKNPKKIILIILLISFFSLLVIPFMGFSLFPKTDKPQFYINIETPPNSSLEYTDKKTKEVEKILKEQKGIKYYTSNVGKGNPQVYYNVPQHQENYNFANIFVQCEDEISIKEKSVIVNDLRKKVNQIVNAKVQVLEYEQGPLLEAPLVIRIFGSELDTLKKYSAQVENIIKSVEGTAYIKNSLLNTKTGLRIKVNKEKAAMYGINEQDIDNAVRMSVLGVNAGEIQLKDVEGKSGIRVGLYKNRFQTMDVFDKVLVSTLTGNSVPIRNVIDIELEKNPNTLTYINKELYATVTAHAQNGYLYEDLNSEARKKLQSLKLPQGYKLIEAGEKENQEKSFEGFGIILITAFVAFIAALILEFGNFKSCLIVLSVIPLGMIGGTMALFITGNPLSFTSMVGFIALAGIEIKNSILLVDYTNYLRKEKNMPIDAAIALAGEVRFIPIFLTTMTAVAGMIPLIIENSHLYSPLALVIVGGLLSSLLLSRIVTPVLYKLLSPKILNKIEDVNS